MTVHGGAGSDSEGVWSANLRRNIQSGLLSDLHLGNALIPAYVSVSIRLLLMRLVGSRTLDDLADANLGGEVATADRGIEPVGEAY